MKPRADTGHTHQSKMNEVNFVTYWVYVTAHHPLSGSPSLIKLLWGIIGGSSTFQPCGTSVVVHLGLTAKHLWEPHNVAWFGQRTVTAQSTHCYSWHTAHCRESRPIRASLPDKAEVCPNLWPRKTKCCLINHKTTLSPGKLQVTYPSSEVDSIHLATRAMYEHIYFRTSRIFWHQSNRPRLAWAFRAKWAQCTRIARRQCSLTSLFRHLNYLRRP